MNKRETILKLIEEGLTSKQICEKVNLKISTIRYYREKGRSENCISRISQHRMRLKRKALDYSGGKCVRCGYKKCVVNLIFHHMDPLQKDCQIASGKTMSWEFTKTEVDKTILLCCLCHGELHSHLWELDQGIVSNQNRIRKEYIDKPLVFYKNEVEPNPDFRNNNRYK